MLRKYSNSPRPSATPLINVGGEGYGMNFALLPLLRDQVQGDLLDPGDETGVFDPGSVL